MYLAHILPVANTQLINTQRVSMALTHLVEKYPEYTHIFNKYPGYKILDNSLIEQGSALDIHRVLEAARMIKAQEIVLPDVLHDGEQSLDATFKAIEDIKALGNLGTYKLMAVCQGKNVEDFAHSFKVLTTCNEVSVIGIPKLAGALQNYTRVDLESVWTGALKSPKPIHLLGCNKSFHELVQLRCPFMIRSCDTMLLSILTATKRNVFADRPMMLPAFNLESFHIQRREFIRKKEILELCLALCAQ